jgi:hypothetical protein
MQLQKADRAERHTPSNIRKKFHFFGCYEGDLLIFIQINTGMDFLPFSSRFFSLNTSGKSVYIDHLIPQILDNKN